MFVNFIFLKGRSIVVDWAIPKNKYENIHTTNEKEVNNSVKEETKEVVEEEIKEEILSDDQNDEEEPSKTIEDYLSLDTTKHEDENYVDFETTSFEYVIHLLVLTN